MNKIDFYKEIKELHERMCNSICELIYMTGGESIDFRKLDEETEIDNATVLFEADGYQSVCGMHVDAVKYDERLLVHEVGYDMDDEFSWYPINLNSNVVPCSIDTVYDAAFNVVSSGDY